MIATIFLLVLAICIFSLGIFIGFDSGYDKGWMDHAEGKAKPEPWWRTR